MYAIRTLLTCYNIDRVHGPRISYVIPSIYVIRMYVITSFHCIAFCVMLYFLVTCDVSLDSRSEIAVEEVASEWLHLSVD